MSKRNTLASILVPRAHDPSGLWQGSRALASSNTGSLRFTDFSSNLIGREYETNALRVLRKSGRARALDPCHRPEGSWALGTRMISFQSHSRPRRPRYKEVGYPTARETLARDSPGLQAKVTLLPETALRLSRFGYLVSKARADNLFPKQKYNKRLNAGEPHNVEQNNLATLLPDLL